jgi:hypothetical protein
VRQDSLRHTSAIGLDDARPAADRYQRLDRHAACIFAWLTPHPATEGQQTEVIAGTAGRTPAPATLTAQHRTAVSRSNASTVKDG